MSDWGAVPDWRFALHGLDQESGIQADVKLWGAEAFTDTLRAALASGDFPRERLSEMVRRILHSVYAVGVDQWEPQQPVDSAAHHGVALEIARQGIVLLKNDGVLPLATDRPLRVAVIGGWAHLGVPSGTGSGAVLPVAGYAATIPIGGAGNLSGARNLYLMPSPVVQELRELLPQAEIEYDPGYTPAEAVLMAKRVDLVIAMGVRVEGEGFDLADLALPWGQDAVIEAVAAANPNTLVVLATGNPSSMPWRDDVRAIVQAWYPGQAGGEAIAEVLTGRVNPSGRLPITFPAELADTPRPVLDGMGTPWGTPITVRYDEGAEVGYRWYAKTGRKPLFPFGYGLSYTSFDYADFEASVSGDTTVTASFTVRNTGDREGADVPQLYLTTAAGEPRLRLLGFERVVLAPGETRRVTLTADPRLLARFDGPAGVGEWQVAGGAYEVALGSSAGTLVARKSVTLRPRHFGH